MYRTSSTLPKELINEFDKVLKENGYTSRRKGLEDAIKEYIRQHKQLSDNTDRPATLELQI